ncbi:phage tail family protein [Allokutzneria sp. A3M-2-11 16]|uniref:phage tail domain-containing protein n=1 Tax=Allokutzneria sp. A3M-2-11 16 TaxID=2962043 RepID=UPI0020B7D13C|nr:phage tail domain-containing protein [Allokutzneria sp. A3M-2-11 16]MCP3800316.1 phage tail family protein [Allokutzneria sp. A3M-2-11 16]
MRVRWQLNGIEFNGGMVNGAEYVITRETGWSGSAPPPADDGQSEPRVIELVGQVYAQDWEARRRAEHRLAALAPGTELVELRCTEETGDLLTLVRRADATLVAIRRGGYELDFSLHLSAPDARKYATTWRRSETPLADDGGGLDFDTDGGADFETGGGLDFGEAASTGRASITNSGTAPTPPVLELHGPLVPPVTISRPDNGSRLTYLAPIPVGETVVIDVGAASVLLDGHTNRRSAAVVHDWDALQIPALSTVDFALAHTAAPNPTARLVARARDAYH